VHRGGLFLDLRADLMSSTRSAYLLLALSCAWSTSISFFVVRDQVFAVLVPAHALSLTRAGDLAGWRLANFIRLLGLGRAARLLRLCFFSRT